MAIDGKLIKNTKITTFTMPRSLFLIDFMFSFCSKIHRLLLCQIGEVFLFLVLHLHISIMHHAWVIPHVFLQILTAICCLSGSSQGHSVARSQSLFLSYRERCRAERKQPRESSESPPALLPASFALAKE